MLFDDSEMKWTGVKCCCIHYVYSAMVVVITFMLIVEITPIAEMQCFDSFV